MRFDHGNRNACQRPAFRVIAVVDEDLSEVGTRFELAGVDDQLKAASAMSQQQLLSALDPILGRFESQVQPEGDSFLVVESFGKTRRESNQARGSLPSLVSVSQVNASPASSPRDRHVDFEHFTNGLGMIEEVLPGEVDLQQSGPLAESISGGSLDRHGRVSDGSLETGGCVRDALLFETGDEQSEVAAGIGRRHRRPIHSHAALQRPVRDRSHGASGCKDVDPGIAI